jgi:hypothetical protein
MTISAPDLAITVIPDTHVCLLVSDRCVMLRCNMTSDLHIEPPTSSSVPNRQAEDREHPTPTQIYRAKVYRAKGSDGWIVEPPRDLVSSTDKAVFFGARAQQLALIHAYEKFGNARFFPYSGDR